MNISEILLSARMLVVGTLVFSERAPYMRDHDKGMFARQEAVTSVCYLDLEEL